MGSLAGSHPRPYGISVTKTKAWFLRVRLEIEVHPIQNQAIDVGLRIAFAILFRSGKAARHHLPATDLRPLEVVVDAELDDLPTHENTLSVDELCQCLGHPTR